MMSSWAMPPGRCGTTCRLQADVVPPALGVGQPDPLAGLQRPAAYAGPGRVFRPWRGDTEVLTDERPPRRHGRRPRSRGRRRCCRRSHQDVLLGRGGRDGPDQVLAHDVGRQHQAVLDRARYGAHRHPGAALLRGREQRGLVDDAAEPVVAAGGRRSRLLRRPGPSYGLADGQVVRHGDHATGKRARLEVRQPAAHPRADHDGACPGPQEPAEHGRRARSR